MSRYEKFPETHTFAEGIVTQMQIEKKCFKEPDGSCYHDVHVLRRDGAGTDQFSSDEIREMFKLNEMDFPEHFK